MVCRILGVDAVEKLGLLSQRIKGRSYAVSADGGRTMIALFEASESHPMVPQTRQNTLTVDSDGFIAFARSLPCGITGSIR